MAKSKAKTKDKLDEIRPKTEIEAKASRSVWKGVLSFGLVTIPVKVYAAVRDWKSPLHKYRTSDLSAVFMKTFAVKDQKEVSASEITKGFESGNKIFALTDNEMASIQIKSERLIDIDAFVDEKEIDARLFEKPYYLDADKGGIKGYSLLYKALEKLGKVGVTKVALRNREYLAIVKVDRNYKLLALQVLRYANELVRPDLVGIDERLVSDAELNLAQQLIEQKVAKFELPKYRDNYVEALEGLMNKKASGSKIEALPTQVQAVSAPDILDALRASVEAGSKKKV